MSIPSPRKTSLIQDTGTINADPLLTVEQAAAYLNVQPQTLNNWRTTGRHNIPTTKVGRLVRYRRSALDAFIERSTGATT